MKLTLTVTTEGPAIRIGIAGDLAYGTTRLLLDTVAEQLAAQSSLKNLHLDFADMTFCDSAGLSALILVHSQTTGAGVALHLDNQPEHLARLLDITGLLEFFTLTPEARERETSDIG